MFVIRDAINRKRRDESRLYNCRLPCPPMRGVNPLHSHSFPCENQFLHIYTESKIPQTPGCHVFHAVNTGLPVGIYESLTDSLRKLN